MKLFQHSNGMIVSFGFDVVHRKADPTCIAWSDLDGKTWDVASTNQAGMHRVADNINPEFIFESGCILLAYQPGLCIQMEYIGPPFTWNIRLLRPDRREALAA